MGQTSFGGAGLQRDIVAEYKKNNERLRQVIERMDQRVLRLKDRNGKNGSA